MRNYGLGAPVPIKDDLHPPAGLSRGVMQAQPSHQVSCIHAYLEPDSHVAAIATQEAKDDSRPDEDGILGSSLLAKRTLHTYSGNEHEFR